MYSRPTASVMLQLHWSESESDVAWNGYLDSQVVCLHWSKSNFALKFGCNPFWSNVDLKLKPSQKDTSADHNLTKANGQTSMLLINLQDVAVRWYLTLHAGCLYRLVKPHSADTSVFHHKLQPAKLQVQVSHH